MELFLLNNYNIWIWLYETESAVVLDFKSPLLLKVASI